ncbi:uncharacterized protein HGUI_01935 [Hanseniaspora guilliermondii]|uniref:ADIPOR-like receptor IZH3 n=1 Tax=Hanseniaspora guilliermondii TaxID=56406 RepID=A0A1L0CXY1_9ASCO|nr:uncharacterized protein HGUI_01935 [Hanseniaspora guilliermondii]
MYIYNKDLINNKKIISDQDCLDLALSSIKNIYAFSEFYKDFDDKIVDVITPSTTSGYDYSSKISRSILFSQMKKKQLVSKSKSLYRKTKETYKHRRRNSNVALNKDEESTSSLQFSMAKKLYSHYISGNSHYNFLWNHSPLKYFFGSDSKSIEKFSLVYKDHSKITEAEMINMMKFLKSLSSISIDDKPIAEIIKLFISHFLKHYNAVNINPKRHQGRDNNLNDLTPLEFMVSVETWINRYIDLVYTTIQFANSSTFSLKPSLLDTDVSIHDNNDESTMFDIDDIYSKGFNDNTSTSLYSEDTFANHSISQGVLKSNTPQLTIPFILDDLDSKIIDESCNTPISEKIDTIYPSDSLKDELEDMIKERINTHNHEHCLQVIHQRPLHYFELPFPYRENKYIINGYRFYDFKTSMKSIFSLIPVLSKPCYSKSTCSGSGGIPHLYHWHNETVNIWTHLVASFYFLYKFLTFKAIYKTRSQNMSISIFFLMSFSCFILSSLWHTLSGWNVVQRRSKACCLDYSGISMLIVSSIVAVQCSIVPQVDEHNLQMYAWIFVSCVLLCMSLVLNWHPKFDTPEFRSVRIVVFVSMAAVGNVSIITLNYEKKGDHFLQLFKNSFVWYLLGVFFYGSFIFERFRKDCLISRIPTMVERTENLDLIQKDKHLYFKTDPYTQTKKLVNNKELDKIDEEINEEIDHLEHGFKSLWWTDYYLQSHNIWHVMVIMGCLGHFRAVEKILENMN